MDRHARQARLAEIGAAGQARIARAAATVHLGGFAADVAARYLAGAGVGRLCVPNPAIAEAARAIDPAVQVLVERSQEDGKTGRVGGAGPRPPAFPSSRLPVPTLPIELRDPVARELAAGALEALEVLRAALEESS